MDSSNAAAAGAAGAGSLVFSIIYLAILVLVIAGLWKTFVKAGQPGWAAIIPLYNVYIMLKIAGKPGWWLILFFIPLVNLVMGIIVLRALAAAFGKGWGFTFGLIFLSFIFIPLLGFGDAVYTPPAVA